MLAFLWVDKTPLGGFSLGSLMGLQPDGGLSWSHLKARQGWSTKMVSLYACLVPHLRRWKSWELPGRLRLFMQPLYVASLGFLTAWKVVGLLTRWLAFPERVFQDAWVKNYKVSCDLALKVTQHYFHHVLLVSRKSPASPDSRGGDHLLRGAMYWVGGGGHVWRPVTTGLKTDVVQKAGL